jgi:Tfp pilus assembly protein PilP
MNAPIKVRQAVLLALVAAVPVKAQQQQAQTAPAQATPTPAAPAAQASPTPPPAMLQEPSTQEKEALRDAALKETAPQPGQFQYNPAGRRDPFVSLLVNVAPSEAQKGARPPGMPGFLIQEVALRGIVKDQSGYIAMLLGPDGRQNYFARVGQRFFDGSIIAIDQSSVTFRQEVTDPLSPVKSRDVKKSLYPSEEARQ